MNGVKNSRKAWSKGRLDALGRFGCHPSYVGYLRGGRIGHIVAGERPTSIPLKISKWTFGIQGTAPKNPVCEFTKKCFFSAIHQVGISGNGGRNFTRKALKPKDLNAVSAYLAEGCEHASPVTFNPLVPGSSPGSLSS